MRIGRYFSVVSVIPAALLVVFVTLVLMAGAWSGPVDPSRIPQVFEAFELMDVGWFLGASLAVALLIHPLKFGTTQLLEGYWGASGLGRKLTATATGRHHRKIVRLRGRLHETYVGWVLHGSALWRKEEEALDPNDVPLDEIEKEVRTREADARLALALPIWGLSMSLYLEHQAYEKALAAYPVELQRVMPTRLGNVLRQSEDRAGKQYGLDTMIIAPHLSLVAKPEHYSYVEDRQKAMDLAITMCLVGALATAASAVLLCDDGWWSLFSFVPFGVAYASYLGAVAAARGYSVAMETVTDLSRFALYDALHVAQPTTGEQEQRIAKNLMALLSGVPQPSMDIVSGEQSSPTTPTIGLDASALASHEQNDRLAR